MCGIAGIVSTRSIEQDDVERMSAALSHRGPDDHGYWAGEGVGLAHRRLSIVDIDAGHQPMISEDGQLAVTFNGEIYNYPELRKSLEEQGRRFRTRCDTEVLLHMYEVYGVDFIDQLRGMFAFALWDARQRRVLLARDHLGQKPLFYWRQGSEFAFASEMKGLFASKLVQAEVDVEALWHHAELRFCPKDNTLFQSIQKLPPAHRIVFEPDTGAFDIQRYWKLDFNEKTKLSYSDAADQLESVLDESVQMHLMSDVPVGAFLSGGVDSSLVSAFAVKHSGTGFPTFSVGVKDSDFTELPFAQWAADTIHSDHKEFHVESDLMLLLPEIIWHLEEPADSHAVGLYLLSRLAREHVKVVMGGDGADEIFGGYMRFTQSRLITLYSYLPGFVRRRIMAPLLKLLPHNFSFYSVAAKAQWAHNMSFLQGAERHYSAMTFFGFAGKEREQLFMPEAQAQVQNGDTLRWIAEHFDSPVADETTDRMLYTEQMTRMPEHFLQIADRMSMAHSLEMRAPIVDKRVAELAASLPVDFKIKPGELKILLREVARRHYPAKLIDRTKMGFKFPMARWFKDELADFVTQVMDEARIFEAGIFNKSYVDQIIREHQSGRKDHNFKIWNLLNYEVWYRLFISGDSRAEVHDWLKAKLPQSELEAAG